MSGELPLPARNDPRWKDVATGRISRMEYPGDEDHDDPNSQGDER